ncbi:MAG TPA: S8 family peptidase [Solirubrobacteraceae bacterium]|nr:S8 family peptidase [Solirubrobacteraceae bacterium]
MRRSSVLLVVSICGALTASAPALAQEGRAGEAIPGQYIVGVAEGRDASAVARWQGAADRQLFQTINGFAAALDAKQLRALRSSARVAYVEPDRIVTADATQDMDAAGDPWGLDRIDQPALPLSRTYTYNALAANVHAYVIDTGLQTGHPDFGGRAQNVFDALGGSGNDCHGHGTHVAGTIGGTTYGVAKNVRLRGVRVLGCTGSGSTSGIIRALDWVRQNHVKPAVANMSLGGGRSTALNNATTSLSNAGVFVAVAAGNENQLACNVSPASTPAAYTTAASDRSDRRASFSNYGSCVDGYAPGVSIKSAWLSGGTRTISGTSMASPHVAGVAALYKSAFGDASATTITNWINGNASTNVIVGNRSGTPNRLLNKRDL